MDRSSLQLAYSEWWILLVLLGAAGLSYALYSKKGVPWTKTQNWVLGIIRFLAICFVAFLLLQPSVRQVKNTVVKPTIAIALDNSMSVTARGLSEDSLRMQLAEFTSSIEDLDLLISEVSINDSTSFTAPYSDLSSLLARAKDENQEENLVGIVLASDGIYNRGISPLYKNYVIPIVTLGLGDTLAPKDISISRTLYNKVTYKDNESPIRLELTQTGYERKEVAVQLFEKGKLLEEKKVRLNQKVQEVEFLVKSENEGLRHLVATIDVQRDESTQENNTSNIFMEVIDGRKKVLIVANAPHPDIKAIRSTLNKTGNYQTDLFIPEIHEERPNDAFDVVIFHGAFSSGINYTPKENPGIWYILSSESSITSVNRELPFFSIQRRGSKPDKVSGSFNQRFSKFKIEEAEVFEEYPPIEVPFGEYSISGPTEILMFQKLGSIVTDKPLMVAYDDGSEKKAVLAGQNIWQWKLQEAAINGNSEHFDLLVTKTVQFLAIQNTKKQFQFAIRKKNITDTESALFDAEVYNDIYERIFGNQISVVLTSEAGESRQFNFIDAPYNQTFKAPVLPGGLYQFEATVKVGDKEFTERGEFSVANINPEYLNLTADHRLLNNLSIKTGGAYFHQENMNDLVSYLEERDFKSKIRSEEENTPLMKSWWWYLIIFLLFSAEWVLRRYWGGY